MRYYVSIVVGFVLMRDNSRLVGYVEAGSESEAAEKLGFTVWTPQIRSYSLNGISAGFFLWEADLISGKSRATANIQIVSGKQLKDVVAGIAV